MDFTSLLHTLGIWVVVAPSVLLTVLGLTTLVSRPLSERSAIRCMQASVMIGLACAVAVLIIMLATGIREVPISIGSGNWVSIEAEHFHFHVKFVFDRLSVPFVILTFVLCGTIGAFTSRYLHRESGFGRFCVFYAFFLLGMIISVLAGTIETLFFGWELVGLSSALLVAYYHERQNPVRNGIRVWAVYRVADAAFLIAALTMHHLVGAGDFDHMTGAGAWPEGQATLTPNQALFVGLLLLIAAAGKSALIPFSGWLPRAMEGPTPSSAIFYGALSVHLGAFLLLRVSSVLALSPLLCGIVVVIGLTTALYAEITARVQTDVKSALAFASLTQVGIIVAEIGFGFRYLALVHIIGHACLRTLQLLRAPSLLRDYNLLENAIGEHLSRERTFWERVLRPSTRTWMFRWAMERGFFDSMLNEYVVRPFRVIFQWCDAMERRWTDFLAGGHSRTSDEIAPTQDELPANPEFSDS
ncbi:MAG: oxidoreductase [Planctomycetaceae bacterium]|nr:oxidoreductase [Planctomycetales bacterium]MCB9927437.1 oxidoreductase [Planctomycetaceae bacterium]